MTRTNALTTGRTWPIVVMLAVLAGLDWWVWLGTDSRYQRDPVTGVSSGPYETPQVVACAVVLIALAIGFRRWLASGVVVAAIAVGFTVPWTVHAAARDSTGLFGVGTVMLLAGISLGGLLVMQLLDGLREIRASRRR